MPPDWTQVLKDDSKVKVAGCDLDGLCRGKVMSKDKFLKTLDSGGFGFCDVIFGWDCMDRVYEVSLASPDSKGSTFADVLAVPDLSTFRRIPWENDMPFFILDFKAPGSAEESHLSSLPISPRGLLKRILTQFKHSQGYTAMAGMEYEFYNFQETPDSIAEKKGVMLKPLTPGMFGYSLTRTLLNQAYFDQIFDATQKFDVQVEGLHTETGPGVYEAALAYTDALGMADRSHLFKTSVKQIASLHGITACFMAKPYPNLPGCSGHIHVSLKGLDGLNAFRDTKSNGPIGPIMSQALAGLLEALPSIMAILAPNINSYKRLVENYWAPITVSYGFENRISAIRIISPPVCEPSATRLEIRVPGADVSFIFYSLFSQTTLVITLFQKVNPYLALAAIVGAMAYGLENKLDLKQSPSQDPKSTLNCEKLPNNLKTAVLKMQDKDSPARRILGNSFVDHFVASRLHECKQWDQAVTDWEVRCFFNPISYENYINR